MKKWINKTICITLSLCLLACLSVFFGCNKKEGDRSSEEEGVKFNSEYRIELLNFENWYPDFSLIKILENFGKVSRNENLDYVKTGKYSAKIQPIGGFNKFSNPTMFFPLESSYYEFNYTDFTYMDHIDFWVYNGNAQDKVISVGLVKSISSARVPTISAMPASNYVLKANSWNLVSYYVDFDVMNITQNITVSQISNIKGIYIEFEHSVSKSTQLAPEYYIDDMNLYFKKNANTLKNVSEIVSFNYNKNQQVYELCDFEKLYQSNVFSYIYQNVKCIPKLSVVNADDENIDGFQATSGSKVLKIEMPADPDGDKWGELVLSDKVVRAFYNQFVIDYDTLQPKIPVEEWKNYRLAYDVYCDFDVSTDGFYLNNFFYTSVNDTIRRSNGMKVSVKSHEWTTWSVSLADISDKLNSRTGTTKSLIDAYNEYSEYFDEHGFGERVSNAGSIRLVYKDAKTTNKVMYVDNIRMYKV